MKRWRVGLGLLVAVMMFAARPASAHVEVGIGMFYSSLAPHGEWITVGVGTYAWRPIGVGVEWRPYWRGRWMWTDWGWYWASAEPWSWATYHYGRWYNDDYYGWIWLPGYEWAPAWVEWRYGPDCVGWAPLGPYAVFSVHFGVSYGNAWVTPYHYWNFVPHRYVGHHDVHRYVYRTEDNVRYIGRTRTGGNVRYENGQIRSRGPDRSYVERYGKIRIPRADIVDVRDRGEVRVTRDGERERIAVYRPRLEAGRAPDAVERPPVVRDSERLPSLDLRNTDLHAGRDRAERGDAVERERRDRIVAPVEKMIPETRKDMERGKRPAMRLPDEGLRGADRPAVPRVDREYGRDRSERPATVPQIERQDHRPDRPEQPVVREQRSRPAPTPESRPQGRDRAERPPRGR